MRVRCQCLTSSTLQRWQLAFKKITKVLLQIRRDLFHPYLLPQPAMHMCVQSSSEIGIQAADDSSKTALRSS